MMCPDNDTWSMILTLCESTFAQIASVLLVLVLFLEPGMHSYVGTFIRFLFLECSSLGFFWISLFLVQMTLFIAHVII